MMRQGRMRKPAGPALGYVIVIGPHLNFSERDMVTTLVMSRPGYPVAPLSNAGLVAWTGLLALSFWPAYVLAQTVVPSQVAPRQIDPDGPGSRVEAPVRQDSPASTPDIPGDYAITIGAGEIAGAFPDMAAANAKFLSEVSGRTIPLAGLFEAARQLESAYAEAGYIFARVIVPPQRLSQGGAVRVQVIDGYIEAIDLALVPASIRTTVGRRLEMLTGRPRLTRSELERALLLAGEFSGLTLRSALVRGERSGGVRLVIEGELDTVSARIGTDNRLPASLGRWQWNGSLALNNLLGLGDQAYVFAGSQFDVARHGLGHPRLGMIGGGVTLPVSPTDLSISNDVLLARTEPDRLAGIPLTVGTYTRAQFALNLPLARTRMRSLDARLGVDLISQSLKLPEFSTLANRDRYAVLRLGVTWQQQAGGGARSLNFALSRGLGGRDTTVQAPYSRQGASNAFTTFQASAHLAATLPQDCTLDISGRAQTSFGQPLFLSEQFALDSENAVSTFAGGNFNVDSGATLRAELILPAAKAGARLTLSPYVFAAGGLGVVEQPTAVERSVLKAGGAGVGGRVSVIGLPGLPGVSAAIGVEVGRQFSNIPQRSGTNHASLTAALRL